MGGPTSLLGLLAVTSCIVTSLGAAGLDAGAALESDGAVQQWELSRAAADAKASRSKRATASNRSAEVWTRLMSGYNKNEPPSFSHSTEVKIGMYVVDFTSINEKTMDYGIVMYLRQAWRDPRLTFDQSVGSINLPAGAWRDIWTPDTFFKNEREGEFFDTLVDNRMITLSPDGGVWYVVKIKTTLSCPMQFRFFPMDVQACGLVIQSFSHTMDILFFEPMPSNKFIEVNKQLELPGYTLLDTGHRDCSENYTSGSYPCLEVSFTFKRSLGPYVTRVFLPSALAVLGAWLALWLGVERGGMGARVLLGVACSLLPPLLALNASSHLPRVAYITVMDVWVGFCVLLTFSTLVELCVVVVLLRGREGAQQGHAGQHEGPLANDEKTSNAPAILSRGLQLFGKERAASDVSAVDLVYRVVYPVIFCVFTFIYWVVCATG